MRSGRAAIHAVNDIVDRRWSKRDTAMSKVDMFFAVGVLDDDDDDDDDDELVACCCSLTM